MGDIFQKIENYFTDIVAKLCYNGNYRLTFEN